jgi:hypothetical protein
MFNDGSLAGGPVIRLANLLIFCKKLNESGILVAEF